MSLKDKILKFRENREQKKEEESKRKYLAERQLFITQQLKAFKAYRLLGQLSIENNSLDYEKLYEENKDLFIDCNIDNFKDYFFDGIVKKIDSFFDDKMNIINMGIKVSDYGNQSLNLFKENDKYKVFLYVVSHEALGGYETERYGVETFDNFSDAEEAFYLRLSSGEFHKPSKKSKEKEVAYESSYMQPKK